MAEKVTTSREIWLDGLRGVAALIVAWFHLTAGKILTPYQSYWDEPASENRRFIQLAPFRIIFAGPGMVCVFFVISGYSISIGLIRTRNEGNLGKFYQKLTSSVVRRMFRLCFPVAVLMLGSHVLFFMGLYTHQYPEGWDCPNAKPWSSPDSHVRCLVRSFVSVVNLQRNQDHTLNDHLWTIPLEILGSMKVYLALLGISTATHSIRLSIIALLGVREWWNGEPAFLAFFAGMFLAEQSAYKQLHQLHIPYITQNESGTASKRYKRIAWILLCALGIYLLCLQKRVFPTDDSATGGLPPDWFFIRFLPPLPWWDTETTINTWYTIGAILLVSSMCVFLRLRVPFETKVAQFLGHISFSLYLCHQPINRIMMIWLLHWTSFMATGTDYYDAREQGRWGIVTVTWMLSIPLIGVVLMLTSRYMAKHVDQKSIEIAFFMERLIIRSR